MPFSTEAESIYYYVLKVLCIFYLQEFQITTLTSEKEAVTEEIRVMKEKMEKMFVIDKKHDLLDLELEEAEARISSLTQ